MCTWSYTGIDLIITQRKITSYTSYILTLVPVGLADNRVKTGQQILYINPIKILPLLSIPVVCKNIIGHSLEWNWIDTSSIIWVVERFKMMRRVIWKKIRTAENTPISELIWDTELWWDETTVDVVFSGESIEDGDQPI